MGRSSRNVSCPSRFCNPAAEPEEVYSLRDIICRTDLLRCSFPFDQVARPSVQIIDAEFGRQEPQLIARRIKRTKSGDQLVVTPNSAFKRDLQFQPDQA